MKIRNFPTMHSENAQQCNCFGIAAHRLKNTNAQNYVPCNPHEPLGMFFGSVLFVSDTESTVDFLTVFYAAVLQVTVKSYVQMRRSIVRVCNNP